MRPINRLEIKFNPRNTAIILSVLVVTGCKIAKPVIPDQVSVPGRFQANDTTVVAGADSSSVADETWASHFQDQKLTALIDSAIRSNPDLLSALQRVERANAVLMVSRNALYPSVNGVAAAGAEKYGDYTLNGIGNFDTNLSPNLKDDQRIPTNPTPEYFLGLRSSWEIDLWGKLKNRKKAAYARLLRDRKSVQFLQTVLVSEVAERYYTLMGLDNELKIIKRNIALQEEQLEIVKIQKEAAHATELAVQQFRSQLLSTQAEAFRVNQEIIAVENNLNTLLGRYPQSISRDSLDRSQHYDEKVVTGLPADLLQRRPDIQEAEYELIAAKADVAAARAAYYPSLQITPFVGLNSFSAATFFSGASLAYGAVGGLTAPLFNQKRIEAAHKIAIADNREAYQQYRKTVVNAYSEVVTQLNAIKNLNRAYQLKRQQATELQNAVATSRDLYLGGRASYLEIVTAQRGVLDAELELNQIQRELNQVRIDLYRSLGGGWR
jgi:outer membrane protein, multidrug efflux system